MYAIRSYYARQVRKSLEPLSAPEPRHVQPVRLYYFGIVFTVSAHRITSYNVCYTKLLRKTLIRDPYAVYAGRILRLRPLDPMRPAPDPRLRGQVLHLIVERFIRERTDNEPPEAAEARLMQRNNFV